MEKLGFLSLRHHHLLSSPSYRTPLAGGMPLTPSPVVASSRKTGALSLRSSGHASSLSVVWFVCFCFERDSLVKEKAKDDLHLQILLPPLFKCWYLSMCHSLHMVPTVTFPDVTDSLECVSGWRSRGWRPPRWRQLLSSRDFGSGVDRDANSTQD